MAHAVVTPPMLRLKRSTQSGTKGMAAVWTVVYTESSIMAYIFAGAEIDLSPMQAGDVLDIRIRKQIASGAGFVVHDQVQFIGAPPATHQTTHIGPIPDVYGVEIAMEQPIGVLRTFVCEFFDAVRLGLA